ncbi:MAG: hypothetical protein JXR65_06930 [Bacteroidales bacterium]|nr:hypothetical protein [Bacteroidales bacterium]
MRFVFPWIIKRFIKRQQDKYNEFYGSQESKKQGDVEIKVTQNDQKSTEKDTFGEYVDFEEIDSEQEKDKNE